MQRLEVSGAVRPIYGLLGVKRLRGVGAMEKEYGKRRCPQAHHDKLLFLF